MNAIMKLNAEQRFLCDILHKHGAMTIACLSEYMGVSRSTLTRLLPPILDTGFVVEAGANNSSGGRKATLYDLNPADYFSLGIDISRSAVSIVITNMHAKVLYSYLLPMRTSCTPMVTLMQVHKMFLLALDLCGLDVQNLIGVGIGVIGPYDYTTNSLTDTSHTLAPEWNGSNIRKIFKQICKAPVCINKGVDMAALGEYLEMPPQTRKDLLYVNCGYGMRKSAVLGGRIVHSVRQVEDAFGHMIIHPGGAPCSCGNRGCVEQYAAIPPILAKYSVHKYLEKRSEDPITSSIHEVFRAADSRNDLATSILTEAALDCSIGVSNLIRILEPELVILSGFLVERCELYYDTCVQAVKQNLAKTVDLEIRKPVSPWKSIAMGAAAMAIEYFLKQKPEEELLTEQVIPGKKA